MDKEYILMCKEATEIQRIAKLENDEIWLPRQEDIQDLCLINGELQRITDYVDTFYEFVKKEHEEVTEYNNSWGKLWLLFTMQNNYSKTWDSEAKMWVSL